MKLWLEKKILIIGLFASLLVYITVENYFIEDAPLVSKIEWFLLIIGSFFAVIAAFDAHRAFTKSNELLESFGSFKSNFSDILEEMIHIIDSANQTLILLLPTPAYGYLFGQQELSQRFVDSLSKFIKKRNTSLELFLVLDEARRKNSLPQRYLRIAEHNRQFKEYTDILKGMFGLLEKKIGKIQLRTISYDPNVRILIADNTDLKNGVCFMFFTQSFPEATTGFEAKGIKSQRRELIYAMKDLIYLYRKNAVEHKSIDQIAYKFSTFL
jgi:hypothetical protein